MKLTFEVSDKLSEEEISILDVMIGNMIYDYELEHQVYSEEVNEHFDNIIIHMNERKNRQ